VTANSDTYVIGPEDVLSINVWREEALTRQVPVRSDGKISLPLVDEIHAAGLTPLQLKEKLTLRLKEFIDNPNVSVIAKRSQKVYVSVNKTPGVHPHGADYALQVVPMAGLQVGTRKSFVAT
jgi:polysaccharide export outer membrane protein